MSGSQVEAAAATLIRPLRRIDISVVRNYGIVAAFIALFITLSIASNVFLTRTNMINLAFQAAPIGIMACGGALVFIAGGFDLSIGAIASFSAVIAGKAFVGAGIPIWPALILGALTGLGFGVGNGLLVTVARVNAFIATLASSIIVYGIAIAVTGGFLISIDANSWATLGLGKAWGINYPIFVWLGFALFCGFLLWQHRVAVGEKGRGVPVVRRGEAIRVTCDDGRDHGMVLHAPNRSSVWPGARSERHNRISERHNRRGLRGPPDACERRNDG